MSSAVITVKAMHGHCHGWPWMTTIVFSLCCNVPFTCNSCCSGWGVASHTQDIADFFKCNGVLY